MRHTRIISILLSVLLLFSIMPFTVLAEDEPAAGNTEVAEEPAAEDTEALELDREFRFGGIARMHYVIVLSEEEQYDIYTNSPVYASSTLPLQFYVVTYGNFPYETYKVYIDGEEVEPDENGLYTIPEGTEPVRVTIEGATFLPGTGEKATIMELILNFIRSVLAFFGVAFGA